MMQTLSFLKAVIANRLLSYKGQQLKNVTSTHRRHANSLAQNNGLDVIAPEQALCSHLSNY